MKTRDVKLSVCIYTYNHEKYILNTVESVLKQQTKYKIEILIFDDCSTDKTIQVLRDNYGDQISIYTNDVNKGYCFNLYKSLSIVQGKYFYSLAGDDAFIDEYVVEKWIGYLETHPHIISATGWNKIVNEDNKVIGEHVNKNAEYTFKEYLQGKTPWCYEGFIRVFWKESEACAEYLIKGARNNEEVPFWIFVMQKGKKVILQDYVFMYRFVNKEGGTNYNSITTPIQGFRDNYTNIKMMERETKYYLKGMIFVRTYNEIVESVVKKQYTRIIAILASLTFNDFLFCIWLIPVYYFNGNKLPKFVLNKIERCIAYADTKNNI